MAASRFDYRRLRQLAPALVLTALGGCLAVLVIGDAHQRRAALDRGRPARRSSRRSSPSSRSPSGRPPISRKRPAPRTLKELCAADRARCSASSACLILAEPDLGTAISLVVVLLARAARSPGRRCRRSPPERASRSRSASIAIWFEPYRRARLFSFLDPVEGPAGRRLPDGAGADRPRLRRCLRRRARPRRRRRSTTCPRRTPT